MATWSDQDVLLDGVSIKSFAFGMDFLGQMDTRPKYKGDAYKVSRRRGDTFRPRMLEAATRQVTVWIDSRREDGTLPTTKEERTEFINDNIRTLMRILSKDELIEVTRVVPLTGGTKTWKGYASCDGEVVIAFEDNFPDYARVGFDLVFHDPVWYEETPPLQLSMNTATTLTHPGEVTAMHMRFLFDGPLRDFTVTNETMGVWFTIKANLALNDTAVFDTDRMTLGLDIGGLVYNGLGALAQYGSTYPMLIQPGKNVLRLTAAEGTGKVIIYWSVPRL